MEMEQCDVGNRLNDHECHISSYTKAPPALLRVEDLSSEEQTTLQERIDADERQSPIKTVCLHHRAKYLTGIFNYVYKNCCDPFKVHGSKIIKKSLRVASKTVRDNAHSKHGIKLTPGWKLCATCFRLLAKDAEINVDVKPEVDSSATRTNGNSQGLLVAAVEDVHSVLGEPSSSVGIEDSAPASSETVLQVHVKIEPVECESEVPSSTSSRTTSVKRKQSQASTLMSRKVSTETSSDQVVLEEHENFEEAVISDIKLQFQQSTTDEKIQLLSILPNFWTLERLTQEFGVSIQLVKQVKKLKKEQGILLIARPKSGKKIY